MQALTELEIHTCRQAESKINIVQNIDNYEIVNRTT